MSPRPRTYSIRQRLILQLISAAALLSVLLYLSIQAFADRAVEETQDRILGASALSIAEAVRSGGEGLDIDIPYPAFSMLGAIGDDRIFYYIGAGGFFLTGYEDLPQPDSPPVGFEADFYTAQYQGQEVRVAAAKRTVLVEGRARDVLVLVAQTRGEKDAIVAGLAGRGALLGLGFFLISAVMAVLTARLVLRPLDDLTQAVTRRGPQDLRPVVRNMATELQPFVQALNGFIGRLSGALSRTETFIAEAAHHIRTPLATLRTQSELALAAAENETAKTHIRKAIRLADDTARSASQLLDHAAVIYRTDQRADEVLDLSPLLRDIAESFRPTADLREIEILCDLPDNPVLVLADRLLIEIVMRNLIDNAVKYSNVDGEVRVDLLCDAGVARVEVRDRGRGLAGVSGNTPHRRFQRGDNVSDVTGSGLGLAIVRDVAAAYGGSFTLTPRDGGGTCAAFLLPLSRP